MTLVSLGLGILGSGLIAVAIYIANEYTKDRDKLVRQLRSNEFRGDEGEMTQRMRAQLRSTDLKVTGLAGGIGLVGIISLSGAVGLAFFCAVLTVVFGALLARSLWVILRGDDKLVRQFNAILQSQPDHYMREDYGKFAARYLRQSYLISGILALATITAFYTTWLNW